MQDLLSHYRAISEAITLLFPGQIEVVLHDLMTGTISHISQAFSNRKPGDESLIDPDDLNRETQGQDIIGPYTKATPDGERLKSVSAVLRDGQGNPRYLLCINMKVGRLEQSLDLLQLLVGHQHNDSSQALVTDDWRERANIVIAGILNERNITMLSATRPDRLVIVAALETAEIFQIRGSAEYVAKALGISRASLYTLLKEARQGISEES